MARRTLTDLRTLLTGATSGIGWQLAIQLAHNSARVLATGRRENRLDELRRTIGKTADSFRVKNGDITDPDFRELLVTESVSAWGGIDIIVNCAGVGAVGPFEEATPARMRQIFEVNFFAAVELIRIALPRLKMGVTPMIVNVSSVLGHRAVPSKSEYCASKFALHGFSDSLRAELAPTGIDVLLVSPSTTSSEFFDNLLEDKVGASRRAWPTMSPERVANRIVAAMRSGKHEIILSCSGRALVWLDRLLPALVDRCLENSQKNG